MSHGSNTDAVYHGKLIKLSRYCLSKYFYIDNSDGSQESLFITVKKLCNAGEKLIKRVFTQVIEHPLLKF